MGQLDGKVAFITGAARGQGRSHAVTLAKEGASIIAVDICQQIETVGYPLSSSDDLAETVAQVEAVGGAIFHREADVRDLNALQQVVAEGVSQFGRLDVVLANAGTWNGHGQMWELSEKQFQDTIDVNLTGAWKTIKATVPHVIESGNGGSIILTSSISGLTNENHFGHYVASKHGVVGLMRTLAVELASHMIRVNTVCPSCVDTPMINNSYLSSLFVGRDGADHSEAIPAFLELNSMPIPYLDPIDISQAVVFLAADGSRYVTGTNMVVDAGATATFKIPH
jgi:SDR family mycofactocin-dependent oxidoreductase